MAVRLTVLALVIGVVAGGAGATEVTLKNGAVLVGKIVIEDVKHLTIRVPLPESIGGGSVQRRVAWGDVRSIDGFSLADWKRREASRPSPVTAGSGTEADPDRIPFRLDPRCWLSLFADWLESGKGFGTSLRLGAIVMLVLLPGGLVLLGGRWLHIRDFGAFRAFGGALIALGAGAAVLRAWPGWVGDWPVAAMGGAAAGAWLVLRPLPVRGVVLIGLELTGLIGAILVVLVGAGSFS